MGIYSRSLQNSGCQIRNTPRIFHMRTSASFQKQNRQPLDHIQHQSISDFLKRGWVASGIIIWRVWEGCILASHHFVTAFNIGLLLLASKTTEKAAASLFRDVIQVRRSWPSTAILRLCSLPGRRLCALSSWRCCRVLRWRAMFCSHLAIKFVRV
jgi:hypothetical protein